MAGLAAVVFTVELAHSNEVASTGLGMRSLYLAEAGLADALLQLSVTAREERDVPAQIGSEDSPVELDGGRYWCTIADNGDDTYTVHSTGAAGLARRTISGTIVRVGGSVFDHAIFAGNRSGDPTYTLRLGGRGTQADVVTGDVYSANDVALTGDAKVLGEVLATGSVLGVEGMEGASRPLPDVRGMDYEKSSDVKVKQEFTALQTWMKNALGGSAFQVPESSLAHIFRKNPNDRVNEITGTAKDDYFLEDPYMPVTSFTAPVTGHPGHTLTLDPSGNGLVYYVDGNLWVHNRTVRAMRFQTQAGGSRATFVVRGNIYCSDSVVLEDVTSDGVAFIAIEDPAHPDSGNVYFGDPRYGTVDRMHAFLYAENDFYDLNLDATGSKSVELCGTMTAGNHVSIQRDYCDARGRVAHSRLGVEFDPRLSRKDIALPGIPAVRAGVAGYRIAIWREVPHP